MTDKAIAETIEFSGTDMRNDSCWLEVDAWNDGELTLEATCYFVMSESDAIKLYQFLKRHYDR